MNFEDIRPYTDDEVQDKFLALLEEAQFQAALNYVNPDIPLDFFKHEAKQISTIKDLQERIILPAFQRFLKNTTNGLSWDGIGHLEREKSYLFVSTHRDIVFDSAAMNFVLQQNGFNTAEIAIGDNLMSIPWVVDLVKLNKSFIVKRNLPRDQVINASKQLSAYINHTLKGKKESIWIAQREGRSKDGNDKTNPSLLKMFCLAADETPLLDHVKSLNICPVSIAYEFNPCDVMTLPELIKTSEGEKYIKAPMEDMNHMMKGIVGHKGKVTVSFGKPINQSIDELSSIKNRNEFFNALSEKIDREIRGSYHLQSSNYIAADLLSGMDTYESQYSEGEKEQFINHMEKGIVTIEGEDKLKRELFLKTYANPVINKENLKV